MAGHFEVINLLLFGLARSHTFSGEQQVSGLTLRGSPARATVGLLAADEARGHFTVGEDLKRPLAPIWIVYSESHFSVLWAEDRRVLLEPIAAEDAEKHYADSSRDANAAISQTSSSYSNASFDLHYWDQLSVDDGPLRLTVDPTVYGTHSEASRPPPPSIHDADNLIPPLDVTIRTRWPGAGIDWNGSEPIL